MNIKPVITRIGSIVVVEQPDKMIQITESGWPGRYHAVTENGATTNVKYELLFEKEIKERYYINAEEEFKKINIVGRYPTPIDLDK